MSHKKVVFMGTPEFSVSILEAIAESSYEVSCVYTQAAKKSNRGQKLNISPIHKCADNLKLIIRNPKNLNSAEEFEFIKKLNPDIVIVVAYGQIISENFLNIPKKGFINIHASLLPKWRGAAPIQRSIMNLDKETGISFMKIEEGLDTGPYMKQIKVNLDNQVTTGDLSKKLSDIGANNILKCIELIENDQAIFVNQDNHEATYAKKIIKSESKIDWNESAENILSKINAMNPSPGAWFFHLGERYKIWKAVVSDLSGKPSEVIDEKLTIACKSKSLQIIEIQKEGKKRLTIGDFLAGNNISIGQMIK